MGGDSIRSQPELQDVLRIYKDGPKDGDGKEVLMAAFLISCGVNKMAVLAGGMKGLFEDNMVIIGNRNCGHTLEISCPPFEGLQIHPNLKKCVKDYLKTVVMSWGHFYKGVGCTSFYANPSHPVIGAVYKRAVLSWAEKHLGWSPDKFPNRLCRLVRKQGQGEFVYDYRIGLDPYTIYGWARAEGSCEDAAYTVIDDNFEDAVNEARLVTSKKFPDVDKKSNKASFIVT